MAAGHPPEVMIVSAAPPAAHPLARMARLLFGSNVLRRPSDRVESAVVATLLAAFVAALTIASFVGAHTYQSERAAGASLRPAIAVLTESGPTDITNGAGEAKARWRAPDGEERSGMLTTVVAPEIENARLGSRVRVWLTSSGDPAAPSPGEVGMLFSAIGLPVWSLIGAGGVLTLSYWLSRLILDKRRLAAWESAWARVGPRWTTHR